MFGRLVSCDLWRRDGVDRCEGGVPPTRWMRTSSTIRSRCSRARRGRVRHRGFRPGWEEAEHDLVGDAARGRRPSCRARRVRRRRQRGLVDARREAP